MTSSFRQQWESAALYCEGLAEEKGLVPVFDAATKAGVLRGPKTHTIVVHPEFPWHKQLHTRVKEIPGMEKHRGLYRERISELLRGNPQALVWQYPGARSDTDLPYSDDQVVPTVDPALLDGAVSGLIDTDTVELALQKMDGIHPKDKFRISGAAMGRCPTQVAVQLYGLTKWKIFIPAEVDVGNYHYKVMEEAMRKLRFLRKRFRFEILHNTLHLKKISWLTKQLAQGTTIIPSPEELNPS